MSTLLDLKNVVSNQLGQDSGATPTPTRDRLINLARQEYYGSRRWSFLLKVGQPVTMTPSGTLASGPMPSDHNRNYDPEIVYSYSGTTQYKYTKVPFDQLQSFPTSSYAYALDEPNAKVWTNQPSVSTLTVDYYYEPADAAIDGTQDNVTEPATSITAICYLAIAHYWLSSERDEANFDRFYKAYQLAFQSDVRADMSNLPSRSMRALPRQLGYNRGSSSYAQKGYISTGF